MRVQSPLTRPGRPRSGRQPTGLGPDRFVRIHRSTLVNLERIRGLELQESGDYEVVLTTQARPRLSRRFKKELQNRLSAPAGIKRSE